MDSLRQISATIIKFLLGIFYVLLGKPGIGKGLTAFVFHDVTDYPLNHSLHTKTYTSEDLFKRQVRWITNNFKVLNDEDVSEKCLNSGAIITFDDGYRSAFLFAIGYLQTLDLHSFHFINPEVTKGYVNSSALVHFIAKTHNRKLKWSNSNPTYVRKAVEKLTPLEKRRFEDFSGPYARRTEVIESLESGLVTIGNHGNNHWLIDTMSERELSVELEASLDFLQEIPDSKFVFSTPHASASKKSLEVIAQAGYRVIFSGKKRVKHPGYVVLPRIDMSVRIHSQILFLGAICLSKLKQNLTF